MDESSLLDLLECPVCLERLDSTAKVLPCQHTFCKRCLQSIVSSRQGELRCPECRTLVRCTVDDLPSNILLLRLLDGITRGGHGPHIPPGQPGQPSGAPVPARVNRAARLAAAALVAGQPSSNGALPAQTLSRSASVVNKQSLPVVPCARALYTYEGKEPGDLPFSKGDLVFLRRRIDDSWYHGETSAGAQGFFPASYVQVLRPLPAPAVPLLLQPAASSLAVPTPGTPAVGAAQPQARPTPPPQCRALYDFAVSGGEQDKDCLTFSKDEVLTVIRRVDENWAEGMLGDKIGIFPISFVEFNTMAKLLLGLESANIHALGEALGQPQPSTSSASSSASSSSSSSSSAASASAAAAAAAAAAGDAGRKNAKKRHSFTSLTMSNKASGAGAQAQAAHQHRHSCDISAPVLISSSNPAAAARIVAATGNNGLSSSAPSQIYIGTTGLIVTAAPSSPVTTVAPVSFHTEGAPPSGPTEGQALPAVVATPAVVPGMPLTRPALPSAAGTTEPAVPVPRPPPQQYPLIQIFVALYPYKPQKADELELRKGEMYRVLERCQDGWYKGSSLRTGTAGVFPGNYVAPVNRAPPVPQQKLPPPVCSASSANSSIIISGGGTGRAVTVTAPVATVTTSQASNGGGLSVCPAAAPPTSPRLGAVSARHLAQGPAQNGVRPAPSSTDKPVAAVPPIQSQGGSPRLSAAVVRPQPAAPLPSLPALVTPLPAAPCPCPSLSSALASVASAITPPNVSAASLDEQAGLGGSAGVSASAAAGGACAGGKNEKGEKEKKERKSSFLKILSSASAKRKSRSPPLSASPPPPQSSHDAQQPEAHAMGAAAATDVGGHGRSLTPPVAPPPRQPCSAMAPVRPETKPLQRERYRVVVPYPPQSDVELELREGDVVFVHRKRDDGWYKGTLQRNGKTGLFPGSFVESF